MSGSVYFRRLGAVPASYGPAACRCGRRANRSLVLDYGGRPGRKKAGRQVVGVACTPCAKRWAAGEPAPAGDKPGGGD